jgi:hypothetical protein
MNIVLKFEGMEWLYGRAREHVEPRLMIM